MSRVRPQAGMGLVQMGCIPPCFQARRDKMEMPMVNKCSRKHLQMACLQTAAYLHTLILDVSLVLSFLQQFLSQLAKYVWLSLLSQRYLSSLIVTASTSIS